MGPLRSERLVLRGLILAEPHAAFVDQDVARQSFAFKVCRASDSLGLYWDKMFGKDPELFKEMDDLSGVSFPTTEPGAEPVVPDRLMPVNLQFDLLPKGVKSLVSGIALHGALSLRHEEINYRLRDLTRIRKGIISPYFATSYNLICDLRYVKKLCYLIRR